MKSDISQTQKLEQRVRQVQTHLISTQLMQADEIGPDSTKLGPA